MEKPSTFVTHFQAYYNLPSTNELPGSRLTRKASLFFRPRTGPLLRPSTSSSNADHLPNRSSSTILPDWLQNLKPPPEYGEKWLAEQKDRHYHIRIKRGSTWKAMDARDCIQEEQEQEDALSSGSVEA